MASTYYQHCHPEKGSMIRHSVTGAWICDQCGYYAKRIKRVPKAKTKVDEARRLF